MSVRLIKASRKQALLVIRNSSSPMPPIILRRSRQTGQHVLFKRLVEHTIGGNEETLEPYANTYDMLDGCFGPGSWNGVKRDPMTYPSPPKGNDSDIQIISEPSGEDNQCVIS